MARKLKPPPIPPSKAYLVSFGDTMTALLAFFIVLNSFAEDQSGANMHSGTGSFINAAKSSGLSGKHPGDRSYLIEQKEAPAPVYALSNPEDEQDHPERLGPDSDPDNEKIINRQTDEFKRFLTEVGRQFDIEETQPTHSQIVFDSFEQLRKTPRGKAPVFPLQEGAIELAAEAITQLLHPEFELEIVVWSPIPSKSSMKRSIDKAAAIETQIDKLFTLTKSQRTRLSVSAKPWLFTDAKRPKISFILSRMATD